MLVHLLGLLICSLEYGIRCIESKDYVTKERRKSEDLRGGNHVLSSELSINLMRRSRRHVLVQEIRRAPSLAEVRISLVTGYKLGVMIHVHTCDPWLRSVQDGRVRRRTNHVWREVHPPNRPNKL